IHALILSEIVFVVSKHIPNWIPEKDEIEIANIQPILAESGDMTACPVKLKYLSLDMMEWGTFSGAARLGIR
ncbi:hypothetical protein BGZ95_007462, partial [Linnemannia exigua]